MSAKIKEFLMISLFIVAIILFSYAIFIGAKP